MNKVFHQSIAQGRWSTFSLAEQLGNIGSEVGRAISWQHKGDITHRNKALERGLELLDLMLADPRWKNRLHELTRAREIVCDVFYGDNSYQTSFHNLEEYFLQFAILVRKNK